MKLVGTFALILALMKVDPDSTCVKDCVGDAKTYKYALADGKNAYIPRDQETPAKFAGKTRHARGYILGSAGRSVTNTATPTLTRLP